MPRIVLLGDCRRGHLPVTNSNPNCPRMFEATTSDDHRVGRVKASDNNDHSLVWAMGRWWSKTFCMGSDPAVGRVSFERSEVRTVGLSLELSLNHFGRKPVSSRGVRFWSMVDKLRTQRAYYIAASLTAQCQASRHLTSGSSSYSSSVSRATIMPRQIDKQRAKFQGCGSAFATPRWCCPLSC